MIKLDSTRDFSLCLPSSTIKLFDANPYICKIALASLDSIQYLTNLIVQNSDSKIE